MDYPDHFWGYHLQRCGSGGGDRVTNLRTLLKEFLGTFETPGVGFLDWLNNSKNLKVRVGNSTIFINDLACDTPSILPVVCCFGIGEVIDDYWSSSEPLNTDLWGGNQWEKSLLVLAAVQGHEYVFEALLRRGAAAMTGSQSALDAAIHFDRAEIVGLLLRGEWLTSAADSSAFRVLQNAVMQRKNCAVMAVLAFLKPKAKDRNEMGVLGSDVATLVAWGGSLEMLRLVFDDLKGTNLHLKSRGLGRTVLQMAVDRRCSSIVEYLLSHGADFRSVRPSIKDLEWANVEPWFDNLKFCLENKSICATYTQTDILRISSILKRTRLPLHLIKAILDIGEFWVRTDYSRSGTLTKTYESKPYAQLTIKSPLSSPVRKIVFCINCYSEGISCIAPDPCSLMTAWLNSQSLKQELITSSPKYLGDFTSPQSYQVPGLKRLL